MSFPYRQIPASFIAPAPQIFSSSGPLTGTSIRAPEYENVPYGLASEAPIEASESGPAPLSIAHIGPCLCRGGAEQQLIDLSRFLDPRRGRLARCFVLPGGRIDPNVARDFNCPIEAATTDAIQRAVQEHDICLFWGCALDTHLETVAERRAVTVFLAHGDSWWTGDLLRAGSRSIDHVIAVSEGVRKANCHGFPTTVIHNGVDAARLATTASRQSVRRQLGFGDNDFVTGFVGRFAPEKRPDRLIRAVASLPPEHKALLVGWGPDKPKLMELAGELLPNRHAFVSAEKYLGDYYQAMDSFALVSENEGFALVYLEAMMSGLPIAATSVGAVPEVMVDGVNGVVVDGTASDIANALARMRNHPHWARGIGQEGRNYAEQFGHASLMARGYESLFEKLVAQRRGTDGEQAAFEVESGELPSQSSPPPYRDCLSL